MSSKTIGDLYLAVSSGFIKGFKLGEPWDDLDELERFLKPLNLSPREKTDIADLAMDAAVKRELKGFLAGFRMGVRLMQECAPDPERDNREEAHNES